jgi:hypothetical protein
MYGIRQRLSNFRVVQPFVFGLAPDLPLFAPLCLKDPVSNTDVENASLDI